MEPNQSSIIAETSACQDTSLQEKSDQQTVSESSNIRTVTYVKPSSETAADAEVSATSQEQESQVTQPTASSRAMQFLPQNGHMCQTSWQFWYYQRQNPFYTQNQIQSLGGITKIGNQPKPEKSQKQESYRDQLKPLGTIPTIEHFFNYYVHMKKPSEMPREIDIFFFRSNLVPMWEVSTQS